MQKRFAILVASIVLITVIGSRTFAQEHGSASPAPHSDAMTSSESTADAASVPHLSADAGWVPPMLIIIAGMFVAARVIGPAVRAEMDEAAAADTHGHGHDDHGHNAHGHGHDAHGHGH